MAKFIYTLAFSLIVACSAAQTGKLIVVIKSIQVEKGGKLSTGVFLKENFPKVGKALFANETAVMGSEMKIVFDQVPAGTYGVVSFQDIDQNQQLKSNWVGYPTEPIGFSRDAKIKLGPPDFDDAKIQLEAGQTLTVIITLK